MAFRKLLVAVDGSEACLKAVDVAVELAMQLGASLIILHVVTARSKDHAYSEVSAFEQAEHLRLTEDEVLPLLGSRIIDTATRRIKGKGNLTFETVVETGDPATVITTTANARGADLVILGKRGLGGVASMLLGSVSQKVMQMATKPCLTVA